MTFIAREYSIDLSHKPVLMGIVNVTPDSFSDGGDFFTPDHAIAHAEELVAAGADMLDLGAESSRPGAAAVSADEECQRLLPVVQELVKRVAVPISIDTTKAVVAEACLTAGAHIINDISGFQRDHELAAVVKRHNAGCILMHMRGTAETMQTLTIYDNLIEDMCAEIEAVVACAREAGILEQSIMIDPGIGFAKTAEQNLQIMQRLEQFHGLGYPLLVGPSRKSFIGHVLNQPDPKEREWGTAAAVTVAVLKGAQVIRVHDVAHMRDVIDVAYAITNSR